MFQYHAVIGIAQSYVIELVFLHELIEEICTQHHRSWYGHAGILKLVELGMTLNDIIEESKTTALASQRAFTDTGKVAVTVELSTVELCHHTYVLHLSVLHYGLEDNLSVGINILQLMPCNMF